MGTKFYIDTSAWGGYYDKEFSERIILFIEQARKIYNRFIGITLEELKEAPKKVRALPTTIPPKFIERNGYNNR